MHGVSENIAREKPALMAFQSMSQQYAAAARTGNVILSCIQQKGSVKITRNDSTALYRVGEATFRILHPVLVSTVKKKNMLKPYSRSSAEKYCKNRVKKWVWRLNPMTS